MVYSIASLPPVTKLVKLSTKRPIVLPNRPNHSPNRPALSPNRLVTELVSWRIDRYPIDLKNSNADPYTI